MSRIEFYNTNENHYLTVRDKIEKSMNQLKRLKDSTALSKSVSFMVEDQGIVEKFKESVDDLITREEAIIAELDSVHNDLVANSEWKDEQE